MAPKQLPSSNEQLQIGVETLTYTLIYTKRKSIGITVRPDMSVTVRAPKGASRQAVAEVVQARGPWILRHLEKFSQRLAKRPQPTGQVGSTYAFLGSDLPINVDGQEETTTKGEKVILQEGVLNLCIKGGGNEARVASLLDEWSRQQAKIYFLERMTELFRHFKDLYVPSPTLKIRRMRARWGSCNTKGLITLNQKLIHLDPMLIDYVIMHELCHLVEHNHSKRFYTLLGVMMPDWNERRQRLNETWMP